MSSHCYVIGSGPSLIGFDFDALPGGTRIGANSGAWLSGCDILCSVDYNFHRHQRDRIKAYGANAHIGLVDMVNLIPGVTYWKHADTAPGLVFSPGHLAGSNSGFASLNLAIQLGFTDIALLGMDMKWNGDRSHFHEGYGQKFHYDRNLAVWAQAFDEAAQQLYGKGIRVTNFVGPMGSRVKAFPTAPLSDLL
jgi:hypothetical protein